MRRRKKERKKEIERKMAVDWVRLRASVEEINHGPWPMGGV
jgi:hypothetical protein